MGKVEYTSVRERVNVLPVEACAVLLAMSEPEKSTEFVREKVVKGIRVTQHVGGRVRSGVSLRRKGDPDPDPDLDLDAASHDEPELGPVSKEEQEAERERFENQVTAYVQQGVSTCRKLLIARLFALAGQDEHSRNERPLLEQAFRGLGAKPDDRIADEDLSYLVTSRMLSDIQQRTALLIARATPEEREQLLQRIAEQLNAMDPAQRERIRQILGVDRLSADVLLKSALPAGIGGAFALGVNAGGFAVYMALTTVIHAVATTLLGVTLPFGAYVFATSFLSAASGGLLLLPIAGLWIVFHRRSRLRGSRSKLAFAVASIISSTAEEFPVTPTWLV